MIAYKLSRQNNNGNTKTNTVEIKPNIIFACQTKFLKTRRVYFWNAETTTPGPNVMALLTKPKESALTKVGNSTLTAYIYGLTKKTIQRLNSKQRMGTVSVQLRA